MNTATHPIDRFMAAYRRAWETQDDALLASLFTPDGVYRNTPFAEQRGHAAIRAYWDRVKLQRDIRVSVEVLARPGPLEGIAHWHTEYQVADEAMFAMWAASTGSPVVPRQSGAPLPRLALDGIARARFDDAGLCTELALWWHSMQMQAPA